MGFFEFVGSPSPRVLTAKEIADCRPGDAVGANLPGARLGRRLFKRWHCPESFLAGEFFHIVQGLWGNDPALLLIEAMFDLGSPVR